MRRRKIKICEQCDKIFSSTHTQKTICKFCVIENKKEEVKNQRKINRAKIEAWKIETNFVNRSDTKLSRLWETQMYRCKKQNITFYAKWKKFDVFHAWLKKNKYEDGDRIVRIKHKYGYIPQNLKIIKGKQKNERNCKNNNRNTHGW